MHLPIALDIIKYPQNQKTDTLVAEGYHLADKAAKQLAVGANAAPIL